MKFTAALALAAASQLASAHTTVFSIAVNGKDAGLGNVQGGYIDSPPSNSPVLDVTSSDVQCNVAGIKASKSITVQGSDKIAFQWHHNTNDASDDIIDPSHKGPIMVYASKAGSSYSWTKIWEDGYNGGEWAVDKLIAGSYTGTKGQHEVTLPNLAPGDYVLRPEIIALHEGNRQGGAQLYMECVHITVEGSGTAALPAGVSFPGAYSANDAGILFDIYTSFSSYPTPVPVFGTAPAPAPPPAPMPPPPTLPLLTLPLPPHPPHLPLHPRLLLLPLQPLSLPALRPPPPRLLALLAPLLSGLSAVVAVTPVLLLALLARPARRSTSGTASASRSSACLIRPWEK